jgi:streptogramin lyase
MIPSPMRRQVTPIVVLVALCAAVLPAAASAALEKLQLKKGIEVQALAAGPHGTLWAAGVDGTSSPPTNFLIRMAPSGEPKSYSDRGSTGEAGIGELIRGPDGWMWFTVPGAEEIDRINVAGSLHRWILPAGSRPTGLAAADGSVWVTMEGVPTLEQVEPGPAPIWSEWGLPTGTSLTRMVLGSDNHLWALQSGSGTVVRQSLQGATAPVRLETGKSEFAETVNSDIAAGDDGNIWVSQRDRRTVGKLVPDADGNGVDYTRYAVPGGPTTVLAPGPAGDIWFADEAGMIGSISTDGKLGEPDCAVKGCRQGVTALARGPGGGLWFAVGGTVEKFTPPPLKLDLKSVDGRVKKGSLALQVRCEGGAGGQSCPGRIEITHHGKRLQRSPYRTLTGSTKELSLPLSRATRELLAAQRRVSVRLVLSVAGKATAHRDFTLRAGD